MAAIRRSSAESSLKAGFTLVELSIVLVIIGLIIGGIVVGQDLISAATVRAQISQIEKYETAVNTFRSKYGALPGDINAQAALQFGFAARGASAGQGDGNGIIEGFYVPGNAKCSNQEAAGETVEFWSDLSTAALIESSFSAASETTGPSLITASTSPGFGSFFPTAKLGQGNFIYVWSGSGPSSGCPVGGEDSVNYFGLSALASIGTSCFGCVASNLGVSVQQAYAIDTKVDDGLPQSGVVTALYLNWVAIWAGTGNVNMGTPSSDPFTTVTPGSSTTCFDNGNSNGAPQQYSLSQNNGVGANCALSFKFQ